MTTDWYASHKWRKLSRQVRQEEPRCWLRFTGCTTVSDTADHIITIDECERTGRTELIYDRANVRGACHHCNSKRNSLSVQDIKHMVGAADRTSKALDFFA